MLNSDSFTHAIFSLINEFSRFFYVCELVSLMLLLLASVIVVWSIIDIDVISVNHCIGIIGSSLSIWMFSICKQLCEGVRYTILICQYHLGKLKLKVCILLLVLRMIGVCTRLCYFIVLFWLGIAVRFTFPFLQFHSYNFLFNKSDPLC